MNFETSHWCPGKHALDVGCNFISLMFYFLKASDEDKDFIAFLDEVCFHQLVLGRIVMGG